MKRLCVILICLSMFSTAMTFASDTGDLENLTLSTDAYWNGSNLEGSYSATDVFSTGGAFFNNFYAYDAKYMYASWGGFAYSNLTDTAAQGLDGQYTAIAAGGQNGSAIYAVGYCNTYAAGQPAISFDTAQEVSGAYFTNTNYAYYSMLYGDAFAKKFELGDWFKLTITGKAEDGSVTGSVEFLLADGTDIVNTWTYVDLSALKTVKTIEFTLTSSDSDVTWGMNTPAYFAMDTLDTTGDFENLTLAAEAHWNGSALEGSYTATDSFTSGVATYNNYYSYDKDWDYSSWSAFAYANYTDTTTSGLDGQYMVIPGSGAEESANYAVGYCNAFASLQPEITFDEPQVVSGAFFTNTNYTYYSMLNGDVFAKKFEAGDWFKLTITGKDASGIETGDVEFLLANGTDIVDTWTWVDLSGLGMVKKITFSLTSSDSDAIWGMNTPAYFAVDGVNDLQTNENGDNNQNDGGDGDNNTWPDGCFIGISGAAIK